MSFDLGKCSSYAGRNYTFPFFPGKVGPPAPDIGVKEDQLIVNVLHPAVVINGKKRGVMFEDDSACHTFSYTLYVQKFINGEVRVSLLSVLNIGIILLLVRVVVLNCNAGGLLMCVIRFVGHRLLVRKENLRKYYWRSQYGVSRQHWPDDTVFSSPL